MNSTSKRTKAILKFCLKLGLSALAMYIVFRKVEFKEVWALVRVSNVGWLVVALLLFNLSKVFSAFRLLALLKPLGIHLDTGYNLKLCYVGMFYNLFLPGSIGGDGYKVVHLNRRFAAGVKLLVASVLLDRVSGGAVLLGMALGFSLWVTAQFDFLPGYTNILLLLGTVLSLPALMLTIRYLFPTFWPARYPVMWWSIAVQSVQVVCAYAILLAFGVDTHFMLYFVLFLVSSLASMLPISLGGVGLRELVFLYASQYLPIEETPAISLGLMYFVVIALSSFVGIFLKLPEGDETAVQEGGVLPSR